MDDEGRSQAGFVKDYYEGIYEAVFDDNSRITWDLASGNSNYYDNAVWQNADGTRSVMPDCEYQLNDITIRVHNGFKITDEYFVKIVIEEE